MQSQEDIFATQTQCQPETQPVKKTKIKYDFVVLCDLDENVKNPFALYPRGMFSGTEIQDKWLDSILDHSSRLKSLQTLERLPGFSLFGKIEEGSFYILNLFFLQLLIFFFIISLL